MADEQQMWERVDSVSVQVDANRVHVTSTSEDILSIYHHSILFCIWKRLRMIMKRKTIIVQFYHHSILFCIWKRLRMIMKRKTIIVQ